MMSRPNKQVDVDAGTSHAKVAEPADRETRSDSTTAAGPPITAAEFCRLSMVGHDLAQCGYDEDAIVIFAHLRACCSRPGGELGVAMMDMNIGVVRNGLGEYDEALRLCRSSGQVFEREGATEFLLMCRLNQLTLLNRLGRVDEARSVLDSYQGPDLANAWAVHKKSVWM